MTHSRQHYRGTIQREALCPEIVVKDGLPIWDSMDHGCDPHAVWM